MRYVIEPGGIPVGTLWNVHAGDDGPVVFTGTGLECIKWCEGKGAVRRGPRLYVREDDVTRFTRAIREQVKRYADGHTEHTDDCMSEWAEGRRDIMTPETVAANHRLHMGMDVERTVRHSIRCHSCGFVGTLEWHREDEETWLAVCPECDRTHAADFRGDS